MSQEPSTNEEPDEDFGLEDNENSNQTAKSATFFYVMIILNISFIILILLSVVFIPSIATSARITIIVLAAIIFLTDLIHLSFIYKFSEKKGV